MTFVYICTICSLNHNCNEHDKNSFYEKYSIGSFYAVCSKCLAFAGITPFLVNPAENPTIIFTLRAAVLMNACALKRTEDLGVTYRWPLG